MNLKILRKTDDEVVVEFEGESHTILNLLRTELLSDKRVKMATYDRKFPVMDNPVFRLKTDGSDPMAVMRDVATRIIAYCDDFSDQFSEAIK